MIKLSHTLYLLAFKLSNEHDSDLFLLLDHLFLNHGLKIVHILIASGSLFDVFLNLSCVFIIISIFLWLLIRGRLSSQVGKLKSNKWCDIVYHSVVRWLENNNEFLLDLRSKSESHVLYKFFVNRVFNEPAFEILLSILNGGPILIGVR